MELGELKIKNSLKLVIDEWNGMFRFVAPSEKEKNGLFFYDNFIFDLGKAFAYKNNIAFFRKQYGYYAPEEIFPINQFGQFSYGLLFPVLFWTRNHYPNIDIEFSEKTKEVIAERLPLRGKVDNNVEIYEPSVMTLRDYQREAIKAILTKGYGRCLVEVPTGGGKSFIISTLIHTLKKINVLKPKTDKFRTLLFLPNTILVGQFLNDLKSYGWPEHSILALTTKNLKKITKRNIEEADVVLINKQLFFNWDSFPDIFDLLVVDEVHTIGDESKASESIKSINAPLKVGFTGTIPASKSRYYSLLDIFGNVCYSMKPSELQEEGVLENIQFFKINVTDEASFDKSVIFNLDNPLRYGKDDIAFNARFEAEKAHIKSKYLDVYLNTLRKVNPTENTLILFEEIEMGKSLYEAVVQEWLNDKKHGDGFSVFYIDGKTPPEKRESIRQALANSSINKALILGQVSIMSTGINIPSLTNLFMFCSNKSQVRTIQGIGRLLRKSKGKTGARIYDLVFRGYKYSEKHFSERKKLYKKYYGDYNLKGVFDVSLTRQSDK